MEDRTAPHVGERYAPSKVVWTTALGPVWSARDQVLGRRVLIQTVEGADQATRARFHARAAAHARVTAPGVAQVYDIGNDPPFAVFEDPGGGRLSDRLRAGALPPGEAARIALALARALEALGEAGLSPGTLHPDSVLVDAEGRARLLALDGNASDASSGEHGDVYALAALTWQMVTGRAPGSAVRKGAGPMDALLRRALDPDPGKRPTLERFVGSLAPHARVTPTAAKQPRARAVEFRWLAPAAIIVALAILAGTVGVDLAKEFAGRRADTPTPSPTAAPAQPLTIEEASDFDPQGDREESSELVDLAVDGDATTSWRTERYTRAGLGGKSGVGIKVDLGEAQGVGRVQILSGLPGWSGEVRISDAEDPRLSDYQIASSFTASESTTVRLQGTASARWVLIWITQLVDAGDGRDPPFTASIAEIRIFGA